jgi:hypothetical protein
LQNFKVGSEGQLEFQGLIGASVWIVFGIENPGPESVGLVVIVSLISNGVI